MKNETVIDICDAWRVRVHSDSLLDAAPWNLLTSKPTGERFLRKWQQESEDETAVKARTEHATLEPVKIVADMNFRKGNGILRTVWVNPTGDEGYNSEYYEEETNEVCGVNSYLIGEFYFNNGGIDYWEDETDSVIGTVAFPAFDDSEIAKDGVGSKEENIFTHKFIKAVNKAVEDAQKAGLKVYKED